MEAQKNTHSFVTLAAFSAYISLFVVLFGPLNIYLNNSDDFSSTMPEMVRVLLLLAGSLFVIILVAISLTPGVIRNFIIRALALIALGSWIFSNFMYGSYGRLDGEPLVIDPWSSLSIAQTVALLVLLVVVAKLKIDNIFKLTGVVFVIGLVTSAISIASLEKKHPQSMATEFPPTLTEFSTKKNVLHVVLDALQSDLFREAVEGDADLKSSFDGFTFFDDTLSAYRTTEMSISTLMTGEVFRNKIPKKKYIEGLRGENKGIVRLETQGYEIDVHTMCDKNVVQHCTPISPRILSDEYALPEALQAIDIYIFKSVPDYFKPLVYNDYKWLLLDINTYNNNYLKFQSGIAHLLFNKFVEDITVSNSDTPRYKFFHSLTTHPPTTLDADCGILDSNESRLSEVEFVKCGLGDFQKLLGKLKDLGIYDQTMIILSSDHGAGWIDGEVDMETFQDRGITKDMLARASATLAVKPFGAKGALEISQAPVSLRDIPQTILAANGLEQNPTTISSFEPRNVFAVDPGEARMREYLYYIWKHEYWTKEFLPPITTIEITGRIKDPNSWPDLGSAAPVGDQ